MATYKLYYRKNKHKVTPTIHKHENGKKTTESLPELSYPLNIKSGDQKAKAHKKHCRQFAEIALADRKKADASNKVGIVEYEPHSKFFDFFQDRIDSMEKSGVSGDKFTAVKIHAMRFAKNDNITFAEITKSWLEDFRNYLKNVAKKKDGNNLSQNTASSYFTKFKRIINTAYEERKIPYNPALNVATLKEVKVQRDYLELSELKKLIKGKSWEGSDIRKAFIFSCYTGMRFGDLEKLHWEDIESNDLGYYLSFQIAKSKHFHKLFIPQYVIDFISSKKIKKGKVFPLMKKHHREKISEWICSEGINKKVTFHTGRRTAATLMLERGADIFVVSKILGHSDISTTNRYLQIVDERFYNASILIPNYF